MAMFAKMKAKPTLAETNEEAEKVEAERESIEDYPEHLGEKMWGGKIFCLPSLRKSSHQILKEWKK